MVLRYALSSPAHATSQLRGFFFTHSLFPASFLHIRKPRLFFKDPTDTCLPLPVRISGLGLGVYWTFTEDFVQVSSKDTFYLQSGLSIFQGATRTTYVFLSLFPLPYHMPFIHSVVYLMVIGLLIDSIVCLPHLLAAYWCDAESTILSVYHMFITCWAGGDTTLRGKLTSGKTVWAW